MADDPLVKAVAKAIGSSAADMEWKPWMPEARAAIAVCRAHFAAMAREHGSAIAALIDIGDDDATAARFYERTKAAFEIAEQIEQEATDG